MKNAFHIDYFDGHTAQKKRAILKLHASFWEISFEESNQAPIIWSLDEISRNEAVTRINTYNYGEFPHQTIQCAEEDLPQTLLDFYPEHNFVNRGYSWLQANKWTGIATLSVTLLAVTGLFFFYIIPNMAEYIAGQLPMSAEIKLGESMAESMMIDLDVDEERTNALKVFAEEVDFETNYPLDFTVVESGQINAFALPGGKIVVFTGLLDAIESPEALVALLGHEAAHVEERHALKALARSLSGYMFVSVVLGDVNGVSAVLLEQSHEIHRLQFSRSLEHSADKRAVKTLENNHLDKNGLVELFEIFQDEAIEMPDALEFLSTHPQTEDRLEFAQECASTFNDFKENKRLDRLFERLNKEK